MYWIHTKLPSILANAEDVASFSQQLLPVSQALPYVCVLCSLRFSCSLYRKGKQNRFASKKFVLKLMCDEKSKRRVPYVGELDMAQFASVVGTPTSTTIVLSPEVGAFVLQIAREFDSKMLCDVLHSYKKKKKLSSCEGTPTLLSRRPGLYFVQLQRELVGQ